MNFLHWRHGLVPLGAAACLVLGLGTAYALGDLPLAPQGVLPADGSAFQPQAPAVYSKNGDGLTYGSALNAISPDNLPDLILVVATNGQQGYVKRTELDAANGDASNFTSPERALAWQAANRGKSTQITVYQLDGRTAIGVFEVGDGQP